MDLYARPHGSHVHSSKDCPMLNDGQFELMKYEEVSRNQVDRRKLRPCVCITESLGLKVPTKHALIQALKEKE